MSDNRRTFRIHRFRPALITQVDDALPDYMNLMGMIFSMCSLMLKIKWCAWVAIFAALVGFANSRSSDDAKQVLSSFMLSISAVVVTYMQNPAPMTIPFMQ
ncbi:unnamed protein product [Rotaria magnacalcarata]|uniref:Protein Asterix n=2 Tax=Rotaria magnacalcarata TaxID=392030 RepID=A0A815H068_9BILA|nr:unnamed protein product [Rotaria magnacalcarata]CAF1395574.1 unnamed protein product [Rotaria magnacalcarata]CAF2074595.1 unnamed protein product [Rotaria magnacalcarata]CAF2104706.1 unnamed protein product [Rotaria magnacalcarata]CAF2158373.1 unnamed protein product [Rotaria magnacalcarata]